MREKCGQPVAAGELVRRIRAGDSDAENELVRRYGPHMMRMLRALTRNPSLAEDLHQETFVIVIVRLRGRGLDDPDALPQFLRQTARMLVMAGNRRKRLRQQTEIEGKALEEFIDPEPGQLVRVLREEQYDLLCRTIAGVRPPRYRQLLRSFYLHDEPKESICAALGLSSIHFNRVLFRARQSLLRELEKRVRKGGPKERRKK
jgi:RNA polymerase sigma-70 factor, ECF subfamily